MAVILAIDTATDACSVALSVGGETYVRQELAVRDNSRLILPMIDELLMETGIELPELDALACTCGPGSFTGLRIGMGVVQGLAFGASLPVLPISTLQTLAAKAIRSAGLGEGSAVIPCLDARMDEVYWGLYRNIGGFPEAIARDRLDKPEVVGWPSHATDPAESEVAMGIGSGWRMRERMAILPATIDEHVGPLARDLLLVAEVHYRRGLWVSADNLQPVYLRDSINWKKRERLRVGD